MADSFPFSITIIVKSKKYWLYRKSRILVDPESHLVSEKRYFCQISDTFKKKKKEIDQFWAKQLESAAIIL